MVLPRSVIMIRGLDDESLAVTIVEYYTEVGVKRKKESQSYLGAIIG